jgi:lysophospholipase L1-like esterase
MDEPNLSDSSNSTTSRRRERIFRIIMFSGVLLFMGAGLLAAEYVTRYRERHRNPPSDYFPSMYYPHKRLRYGLVPNLDYYGWFRINSMGFRGREVSAGKPPGTFRIVCLGGSTTFDTGSVGSAPPWPEVLEAELRRRLQRESIEVLNLGIPGATSLDSLIDLQMRALALQPDLVIVYQAHNDLIYSVPPPYREDTDLFPLEDRPRSSLVRWLNNHSLLYAKSEERVFSALGGVTGAVTGLFAGAREPGEDRDTALERGLASFRSNMLSLAAIARVNKIPAALVEVTVPFPSAASAGKKCQQCEALSATYGNIPVDKLRALFSRYDDALEEVAAMGPGVYHVGTADFVPAEDVYYHDPVHFGPEGSLKLGTKLGDALASMITELARQ